MFNTVTRAKVALPQLPLFCSHNETHLTRISNKVLSKFADIKKNGASSCRPDVDVRELEPKIFGNETFGQRQVIHAAYCKLFRDK